MNTETLKGVKKNRCVLAWNLINMLFTCITVPKWVGLSGNKVSFIIINIALIGHEANLSSILTQYLINTDTHCFFFNLQKVIRFLQYATTHTILQHIQTDRGSSYMAFRMQKSAPVLTVCGACAHRQKNKSWILECSRCASYKA